MALLLRGEQAWEGPGSRLLKGRRVEEGERVEEKEGEGGTKHFHLVSS